jgi:hypothetical protein
MTAAHQHAISAKANFLREQEVKRSGRSQNPSTDARRQGMTAAHQHAISAKANFLREQEVKRSGRSQNPFSMRGGKV